MFTEMCYLSSLQLCKLILICKKLIWNRWLPRRQGKCSRCSEFIIDHNHNNCVAYKKYELVCTVYCIWYPSNRTIYVHTSLICSIKPGTVTYNRFLPTLYFSRNKTTYVFHLQSATFFLCLVRGLPEPSVKLTAVYSILPQCHSVCAKRPLRSLYLPLEPGVMTNDCSVSLDCSG